VLVLGGMLLLVCMCSMCVVFGHVIERTLCVCCVCDVRGVCECAKSKDSLSLKVR